MTRDALKASLARFRSSGLPLRIWWRDDDAVEPSRPLDQLFDLADSLQMPVHLAVIPRDAEDSLAEKIEGTRHHTLVHGWAHENHSAADAKKAEFGAGRAAALGEAKAGLERIARLFPKTYRPIFVPPWNRIDPDFADKLPGIGFHAVSTFGPRTGVAQVNTHLDPIWWRQTRDLVPPDLLYQRTVDLLEDRIAGKTDASEPLGFLTHHLVHTPAIWDFTKVWFSDMLDGGASIAHDITGDT